jgi:hypothetical protein
MIGRTAHNRRQRRALIGLALMFFAPLALAFYLYYGGNWHPGSRVNNGDLIEPPRPLPALALPTLPAQGLPAQPLPLSDPGPGPSSGPSLTSASGATSGSSPTPGPGPSLTDSQFLRGKWTFLYVQRGSCGQDCLRRLYDTRQVRLALDREMTRVQRVFIADADCCDMPSLRAAHPDLIVVADGPGDDALLALLPGGTQALDAHRVYVIDPLGNLMMFYPPDAKPKGMLEDMKRLLRLSSIG